MTRFVPGQLLIAAVVVSLAACGAQTGGDPVPSVTGSTGLTGSPETESTDQPPPTEATGTERPRPTEEDIAISVPTLPIGGDTDDPASVDQCVVVSWLGSEDIPDGVAVSVTRVEITPAGVFDRNGSGCGGEPGCDSSFAFTSERTACSVRITARGTEGKTAKLVLSGAARCPAQQQRRCSDLVESVRGQSIQLQQPFEEEQVSSEETTTSPTS